MTFGAFCASHAPLVRRSAAGQAGNEYVAAMGAGGEWIRSLAPDLVIEFFPDHFNGFFYDAMPNFCVGLNASSIGDWDTSQGRIDVPTDVALALVEAVRSADIDVDASYGMQVDHGFAQVLDLAVGGITQFPTIPIMVNCAAPPRPSLRRVRLLGEAVGRFAKQTGKRVLFVGSGGLSHDPPIPNIAGATDQQKAFLLSGRNPPPEARSAREGRVVAAASAFAEGKSDALAPDEDWDLNFVGLLRSGNLSAVDAWREDDVTRLGGCGGHEVRTWVAALSALSAAGGQYDFELLQYAVIPEWMTGMGVARAYPRAEG